MKGRKIRTLVIVALAVVLLAGILGIYTMATSDDVPPTVVYDHGKKAFVFRNVTPYEGNVYPNLFADQDFIGMMPGDVVEEEIVVTVEDLNGGYAEIYLYAESVNEDITPEEAANFDLLMENATVLVSWTGRDGRIYRDELEAENGRVHLGTFYDGDEVTIQVDFGIDIEAGNELQFIRAEIGWVFVAEVYERVTPPVEPDIPILETKEHYAYIIGHADGNIHPTAQITRAEVATIFFRMFTEDCRKQYWSQTNPYYDVYAHEWYNNAISTLTNAGILNGYPDGLFYPNESITRAEFAAIASRFYADKEGTVTGDAFTDIAGHWANEDINLAYAKGLINGYPDGTFRPDAAITRAEAIAIVNRLLGRWPDKSHLLEGMIEWPDNMDTEAWYYADIQEATNSHTYVKLTAADGTTYEIWKKLESVRDWAALEQVWSEYDSSKNPGEVILSTHRAIYR